MTVAKKGDVALSEYGTKGLFVKYGDSQLAVFYTPRGVLCVATDVRFLSSLDVSLFHDLFWIGVCVVQRLFWVMKLLEVSEL